MNKASIKKFKEMFSEKIINEIFKITEKESSAIFKESSILDIIAVTNGYKDYKTASGLYKEYLSLIGNTWIPLDEENEINDQDFLLTEKMDLHELSDFYKKYGEYKICSFDLCIDEEMIDGIPVMIGNTLKKVDIINIIENNSGIYFDYEHCNVNGHFSFSFLYKPEDKDKARIIEGAVYGMTVAEYELNYGRSEGSDETLSENEYFMNKIRREGLLVLP